MAKENLDRLEQFGIDVILGRRRGVKATLLRGALNGLSRLFHGLVQARLSLFRHRIKTDYHLGATVISIGNLTVGGTGKTPVVEMLARRLNEEGRKVGILSRGYKRVKPPLKQRIKRRIKGQKPEEEPPTVVSTVRPSAAPRRTEAAAVTASTIITVSSSIRRGVLVLSWPAIGQRCRDEAGATASRSSRRGSWPCSCRADRRRSARRRGCGPCR